MGRRVCRQELLHGFDNKEKFLRSFVPDESQSRAIESQFQELCDKWKQKSTNQLKNEKNLYLEQVNSKKYSRLKARGNAINLNGKYKLKQTEIEDFENDGILGPFPLLDSTEATRLYELSMQYHESTFDDDFLLGLDVKQALKRKESWSINYSGLFQALKHREYWDIVCRPEITDRLACLLGDDIIVWRTQFFQRRSGEGGTFWHQQGTFKETSVSPKLVPTLDIHHGMVQLTVWVALTDVRQDNGCMRFLPGSYADGRLEYFMGNLEDKLHLLLYEQDELFIRDVLKILLFSPGTFLKAQIGYELARKEIQDLLNDYRVENVEMKAGQFIIFSSLNMHASFPNISDDDRLAFAARYTTNDVKVYPDFKQDFFASPEGNIPFSVQDIGCIQARGVDKYSYNRIASNLE